MIREWIHYLVRLRKSKTNLNPFRDPFWKLKHLQWKQKLHQRWVPKMSHPPTPTLSTKRSMNHKYEVWLNQEVNSEKGTPGVEIPERDIPSRSCSSNHKQVKEKLGHEIDEVSVASSTSGKNSLDPKAQLSKLKLELELEDNSKDYSPEELRDWIFDHVEKNWALLMTVKCTAITKMT